MVHKLGFNFLITHGKQMKIYCDYCCLNVGSAAEQRLQKVGRTAYPNKNIYANRQQATLSMGMCKPNLGLRLVEYRL